MTYVISVRPRRQVTLPREVLNQLGLEVGDALELTVTGKKAVLAPQKQTALDALVELQRLVKESGVSEAEFQASGREIREELNEKRAS